MSREYPVPYGLDVSVRIERGEHAEVVILAPMYVTKERRLTWSYSLDFTDQEILRDHYLVTRLLQMYGP